MKSPADNAIKDLLNTKLKEIENLFEADVITFCGSIIEGLDYPFRNLIEDLKKTGNNSTLYIILTTPGGSAIAVEKLVTIIRQHYQEVNFIVPEFAYSAGTIFCMSGDSILMDYCSFLGPIDPQVQNKEGKFVAALAYLDRANELIEKSRNNTLTKAEFAILMNMDQAELKLYEQAKELTIDLLKKWLVQYKFKNWKKHRTDKSLIGTPVTEEQKK